MSAELEAAAADSAHHVLTPGRKRQPPPGATCANCGAPLQGPWCHACGQEADTHKRSILHLTWEAIEGLFHLDGRLLRTLPALFFRPGGLARDYMEGRIVRHVPPFRTFLVALLLFIFAAEHAIHELSKEQEQRAHERAAALATPEGRARIAGEMRAEAAKDRDEALGEAATDRAQDLKDPDEKPAAVEARFARQTQKAQANYAKALAKADLLAQGKPLTAANANLLGSEAERAAAIKMIDEADKTEKAGGHTARNDAWMKDGIKKAAANPEYYLTVMFAWGHRLAVLLLPIVGLSLALAYVNKRQYFIYDHLLVATNFLSFTFLSSALGLVLPQPWGAYWLGVVALWTLINLFQTLRGAYGSSILGALVKTLFVWIATVFAFTLLLAGLMIFTLGQL